MSIDRNLNILKLYNNGMSSKDIGKMYGISTRQVQRILSVNVRSGVGLSKSYQLNNLRAVVVALMTEQDRDFNRCELCACVIPKDKFELHHTKYNQATYNDLKIVCHRCNTAPVNI